VLPGAEPFSAVGGPDGVLVLHGFTGSPHGVRGLAEAFAANGLTVELPLLPGHGTAATDLAATGWPDWSAAAELAFQELSARCRRVAVAGLSMGGTLGVWLAAHHRELTALVTINPFVDPPAPSFFELLRGLIEAQTASVPGFHHHGCSDPEVGYGEMPLPALLSLCEALLELAPALPRVRCPTLVMTSPGDHVVPPVSSDVLAAGVSGPVERVTLARSCHMATLGPQREELERHAVAFVTSNTRIRRPRSSSPSD
jgi:carboxylesterase